MTEMIRPLFPIYRSGGDGIISKPVMPQLVFRPEVGTPTIKSILRLISQGDLRVIDKDGNELKVKI